MTKREQIIEVMEAAYEKAKCGHPDALHDKPMQAALTALESAGYIVRPREATEGMLDYATQQENPVGCCQLEEPHLAKFDTAMTEAWLKEMNGD